MQTIWHGQFDHRYNVDVYRKSGYEGTLKVSDTHKDNEILLEKDVTLAYGAQFGPDYGDVQLWCEIATNFVDRMNKKVK